MKLKSYLFIGLAALALASCDDDFGDWVVNPNNAQGEIAIFGAGSVTPVSTIDFRNVGDDVTSINVCSITAPTASDSAYNTTYKIKFGDTAYDISASGNMTRSDLEDYVNNLYGKRPVERDTKAAIVATISNGTQATRITSDSFDVKTIAKAPEIEQKYYITGNINGWDNTNTDYLVTNGGGDVYDDPIFTIVLDATGSDIEFKLTPESGLGDATWSKCVTAAADGTEGKLADNNAGGNLKITNVEGAKKYRVTFNLLDQTWSYEALNFGEFFYEIGNESGWSTSHALYGANYDGNYLGYYYLNGEFKFKPNADNWNNDYEYNGEGKIANIDGGSNIPDPGAGFYRISVNLADLTYNLLKVNTISVIGNNDDWNTDYDMTYNTTTGNWEWTGAISGGGIKFRVNHDWTYSWGGKSSATDYDNLTENNGINLSVPAGTYKVTLTVHQENGNCKVSFVKQ